MSAAKKETRLVEVHGEKLTTTSLIIADLFGRPHGKVLAKLDDLAARGRIDIGLSSYKNSQNKTQRMIVLDERSFLIAMPFIGGVKSEIGQVKLVDEFLRLQKLLTEPGRKQEIQSKRDEASAMTDMLKFIRESDGKDVKPRHFCNEHFFCNRALTGRWESLDESDLDVYDTRLLVAIRSKNTLLMARYPKQENRKQLMDDFVSEYRARRPRISLVEAVECANTQQ